MDNYSLGFRERTSSLSMRRVSVFTFRASVTEGEEGGRTRTLYNA